ncbi:MAG: anthranilate phosphoribosyltransferase [Phycisphaerae bacterium]
MIKAILEQLVARQDLSAQQMRSVFEQLMNGELSDTQMAAFLIGLECKGVTSEELAAAAGVMREKVTRIPIDVDAVDTCGTGGDGICTFNISSAAAIIAAGAGVYVAKHGNRTNTRRSGSAEAFAALGVNIEADVETVVRCIHEAHIGFCYAVKLHPAMKYAAGVRRALGVRTIFNLLGPMTNPAGVRRQIIGVSRSDLAEKLACALRYLGTTRAMIIHGLEGLCDISINGPTKICELINGEIKTYVVEPEDFGIHPAPLERITVDSPEGSAKIIKAILNGESGPARDIAALNAAAAIVVAGQAKDLPHGLKMAYEAIDSGAAKSALEKMIEITNNGIRR